MRMSFLFPAVMILSLTVNFVSSGQTVQKSGHGSATPLINILHLFTAQDVPVLGPAETKVDPLKTSLAPVPENLPGKGALISRIGEWLTLYLKASDSLP